MTIEEREFHKSRLMWAFIDGEIYWTYSEDGHKEWLDKTFKNNYNFENTVRGYMRREDTKVHIVAYMGSNFNQVDLSKKQIKTLIWLAELNYTYDKLMIYSGIIPGKPGEIWKPKVLVEEHTRNSDKIKLVSYLDLIRYEDFIVNLLNRDKTQLSEIDIVKEEYHNLLEWMKGYYKMNVTTSNRTIRRAYIFNN